MVMAKRTTPRSEAREFATTSNQAVSRDAASSTAIDINRQLSQQHRDDEMERSGPSEDDIRRRAYQRYLERGAGDGYDFEDWLEAERELRGGLKADV